MSEAKYYKKYVILPHREGGNNDYEKFFIKKHHLQINNNMYILDDEINIFNYVLYTVPLYCFIFQNELDQVGYMGLGSKVSNFILSKKEKLINPDLSKVRYHFIYEDEDIFYYDIGDKPFKFTEEIMLSDQYKNNIKDFQVFINSYSLTENIKTFINDIKTSYIDNADVIFSHPAIKHLIRKEKIKKYII